MNKFDEQKSSFLLEKKFQRHHSRSLNVKSKKKIFSIEWNWRKISKVNWWGGIEMKWKNSTKKEIRAKKNWSCNQAEQIFPFIELKAVSVQRSNALKIWNSTRIYFFAFFYSWKKLPVIWLNIGNNDNFLQIQNRSCRKCFFSRIQIKRFGNSRNMRGYFGFGEVESHQQMTFNVSCTFQTR